MHRKTKYAKKKKNSAGKGQRQNIS